LSLRGVPAGVAPSNLFEGDAEICSVLFMDVITRKEKIGEDDNILSEQESKRILSVIARRSFDRRSNPHRPDGIPALWQGVGYRTLPFI